MDEVALSSRLSTSEKLLISQAVYKLGALDWEKISGLLVNHPVIEGRPAEWFDAKTCEAYYVGLMTEAGINVPAQDASRPQAKVHLRLAQKFYQARLQELKTSIAEYEHRFSTLMSEIAAIKSGSIDQAIKEEIRGTLAKKFGKKLLDSWVPDEGAVKEAVEAGPPTDEELKAAETGNQHGEGGAVSQDVSDATDASADVSVLPDAPVDAPTEEAEAEAPGPEQAEGQDQAQAEPQAVPKLENPPAQETNGSEPVFTPPAKDQDVDMEVDSAPPKQLSPVKGRVSTPVPVDQVDSSSPVRDQANAPSSPASDLSSAPDDETHPTRSGIKVPETPVKTGRTSKRKASMQPRGAATSKRSRRKASTPIVEPEPEPEPAVENAPTGEGEEEKDVEMAVAVEREEGQEDEGAKEAEAADLIVETPKEVVEEEEPPTTRGRRTSKRESVATGRSKRGTSPAASSSKHASPQPSQSVVTNTKRGASVSSAKSATPATPVEDRRSSRRNPKGRGMRDEVVSKSVREQTVESVKEEEGESQADDQDQGQEVEQEQEEDEEQGQEEEQEQEKEQEKEQEQEQEPERPPTRSSRRVKDNTTPIPDLSAPLPDTRKGTRRSMARGSGNAQPDVEDEKPVQETPSKDETPKETKKQAKRPRHSSPRESKTIQKMLNGLLDQISGHRNGNVFAQPVRPSDAPDYHKVIKRPMDLKTIRSRIRDGHITTIDEFERDITLMFANAIMFNAKGTPVHDMAVEMMQDSEEHIRHLKSVQRHMGR